MLSLRLRSALPVLVRAYSSRPASSFPSLNYPGLYFHPSSSSSSSYSLSFLPEPAPSLEFSPTTIGQLSSKPGQEREGEPEILPRYFRENPQFLNLVHEVLRQEISKGDDWVESLAKSIVKGGVDTYIHLGDQRNPAEAQRTAQPQDIIASILVRGHTGQVIAESYEPNKVAYRVVSELGLMRLPDSLFEKLVHQCTNVRRVEVEIAQEKGRRGDE